MVQNVSLKSGANVVNHLLGRPLVGWRIVRINAASTLFDEQDSNQTPAATLVLVSSAPCMVNLEVF
jgi:hypothetical protein